MNQAERIKRLMRKVFREVSEEADTSPMDAHILRGASATMKRAVTASQSSRRVTLWRTIMQNRVTQYSAAAVVALAMALVLFQPDGYIGGRGIAWAEVAQKVSEIQTIVHKEKRSYYEVGQEEPFLKADAVKYISSEHGIVEEQYDKEGNLMHRVYIQRDPLRLTGVLFPARRYFQMPVGEAWARMMERLTPMGLVDHFKSGDYKELGHRRFEGHDCEGIEAEDTGLFPLPAHFRFLFPVEKITWRWWIDVESLLPVAVDMEFITDRGPLTGFRELRVVCHAYDMDYDADLSADVFEPNIPEGYEPLNLGSVLKDNAAWLGVGALPIVGVVVHKRRHRARLSRLRAA